MQARKSLLVGAFILANISLKAQDNGGCDDCPAFNASGKVEVRGVKERIIGDLSQPISARVENLIFPHIIIGMNACMEWLVRVK